MSDDDQVGTHGLEVRCDYEAYMMFEVVGFVRGAADATSALEAAQGEDDTVTHVKEIPGPSGAAPGRRRRFDIDA
jgi:hypothetical protein